jgi:hypothetical protein
MRTRCVLAAACALGAAASLSAGGAWVPDPGTGWASLGFSRKTASTSWDGQGKAFLNTTRDGVISYHDFRYVYLSGEVGVVRNLSFEFLITYLYGLEGPHSDPEKNAGLSDSWLGAKYQVLHGELPVAVEFVYRTPYFYDLPGAYSRYLYNSDGTRRTPSPEWRGLLNHDYTINAWVSRSFDGGKSWTSLSLGYTWREGAPADQIPASFEAGHFLFGIEGAYGKLTALYVRSRANNSTPQPDDRFSMIGDHYNFNRASMARVGITLGLPISKRHRWSAEIGYNQWVWGRSARRYREPFVSVFHAF